MLLLGALSLILLMVIILQIGKVTEIARTLRGEREAQLETNRLQSTLGLGFLGLFLIGVIWSAFYYKNQLFGFGPNEASSSHGRSVDFMFEVTLYITLIVFFLTHILLFWYGYKFRERENTKAVFWHHDNRLELLWMAIPAVTMTFLVIQGLVTWNKSMSDIPADAKPLSAENLKALMADPSKIGDYFLEVEATGYQFGWALRHPGADGELGDKYFTNISGSNPLGQIWTDKRNHDDVHIDEIVIPKNLPIRVRITAMDVLHNFYLPQFRVKMDAVPGMPTYFVFTPITTTEEQRQVFSKYPEWQTPSKDDPEKQRWEVFDYELACAELCGKGHYSMKRKVRVVSLEEYATWVEGLTPYYTGADTAPTVGQTTEN
jgi:cytochrome c oxidase subunit 2